MIQSKPILVEQVFGNFDDYNLYDTSTLRYNNKIYFFKRIFEGDQKQIDKILNPSKRDNYQNDGYQSAAGLGINGIESKLQLYSYDLCDLKTCSPNNAETHPSDAERVEENLERFQIDERNRIT